MNSYIAKDLLLFYPSFIKCWSNSESAGLLTHAITEELEEISDKEHLAGGRMKSILVHLNFLLAYKDLRGVMIRAVTVRQGGKLSV